MILKEFLESGISYKVHKYDMPQFLEECKANGLEWWFKLGDHHPKAIVFNPFDFYSEHMSLLIPLMQIDDENYVYIKCFDGLLYWSFHYDWNFQPFKVYGKE